MNKSLIIIHLFLIFTISLSAQETSIDWEKDYNKAQKMARQTGKPLLLDFTASWCKPCLMMDKEFWVRNDVVEAVKPFIAVKIDYDAQRDLAGKYGATAIPYVVFADPLGNLVTFRRGFGSKNVRELGQILSEMPKDFSSLLPSYEAVEKNKNDGTSWLKIADFYRKSQLIQLSCDFYKKAFKTQEIQNNESEKERVLFTIGANYFSIRDYKNAEDFLGVYLKTLPAGKNREQVIYAHTISNINLNKMKDAEKSFGILKSEFPNSKYIVNATDQLEKAKLKK